MYQSVSPNVNFVEQEKKIEAFWEEEHIFEKSIDSRKKGTPYVFYDGPIQYSRRYTKSSFRYWTE